MAKHAAPVCRKCGADMECLHHVYRRKLGRGYWEWRCSRNHSPRYAYTKTRPQRYAVSVWSDRNPYWDHWAYDRGWGRPNNNRWYHWIDTFTFEEALHEARTFRARGKATRIRDNHENVFIPIKHLLND